jgi:carotenoid cleavage dioxygenase
MTTTEPRTGLTPDGEEAPWFLAANFAPVDAERTITDLEVSGSLPPQLTGRYVRTGPNPVDVGDPANHHWFLGDGMVHGVELQDGRATWYRNRFVVSPEQAARAGVDPVPTPADTTRSGQGFAGSGNTNVFHHAGSIWAINELSLPYELTPELDTVRAHNFGGPLPAGMNAHPKFDPATGEMHVMGYSFVEPFLRYHVVDAAGALTRTEEIAVGGPIMVHDMALTEQWVVAFDLPVVFDFELVAQGRRFPYRWDATYQARVGLMPRNGSGADTVWIDVDPCYTYHPLNAYDEDGRVVVDLVVYSTMFEQHLEGPVDSFGRMERWVLDPAARTWSSTVVDERAQEFPRGDERLATRKHRYGYVMNASIYGLGGIVDEPTAVLKYDFEAGTVSAHELGAGRHPGEFVFVPESDDAGEDEGWLMGYVHDLGTGTSELVVLDASDMGAEPVARVHLPLRVPTGFHGNWIPDRALS